MTNFFSRLSVLLVLSLLAVAGCGGDSGEQSPKDDIRSDGTQEVDDQAACTPDCACKTDGADDGCGGTCQNGVCEGCCQDSVCLPGTEASACGTGGFACQECNVGQECVDGTCDPVSCTPLCDGKVCGSDGCGGECGTCETGQVCDATGACVCAIDCIGKCQGADDGCGGACEANGCVGCCDGILCQEANVVTSCGANGASCQACDETQVCEAGACVAGPCVPDCTDACPGAPDGCGGACSAAPPCGGCCDVDQRCHMGDSVEFCGIDGGACFSCDPVIEQCDPVHGCECAPQCEGRECGEDGCGGSCGSCAEGQSCKEGKCQEGCIPNCDCKNAGAPSGCGAPCSGNTCQGCCTGQICHQGVTNLFCGKSGVCDTCTESEACVDGYCIE